MSKRMLVNAAQEGEVRVGIVENNVLEDLSVAIAGNELIKGNIYKATVVSVESGLQAAFLDYGAERNGFITFNDINPRYYNKDVKKTNARLKIQDAVAPGAQLLVQVYKEEVGNKGAAFTSDITIPGRYLVLMPFSDSGGVSRKIESESARKKLKDLIAKLNPPEDMGVIVRTAGEGRTKTELQKDFQAQLRVWGHAQARFEQLNQPGLVHAEPDVVIRSIRDYVTDDVTEIVVDHEDVHARLVDYFEKQASDIVDRIKPYRGKMPIFSNFGLERQLENIASPKVPLPSGGSIVINPTEALTAVDVNSGKSRGQRNQEEMALSTNVEAAEEVARQLRLRDLGGLVVIDFIDMFENKNRRTVEKTLKQAMKRDKARVEVGRISRFGMLELSRQRIKARLISSTHNVCPMCEGSGFVLTTDVAAMSMLRRLQELSVSAPNGAKIRGRLHIPVALKLLNEHRTALSQFEKEFDVQIEIIPEIGALTTREAFEIVRAGASERSRDDRDRRDRRDRHRGRNRKRSSMQTAATVTLTEDADDEPYEPPRVVGFIDPETLATADLGPEPEGTSENETQSSEDSGEGGRRRRRRRRRRRSDQQVAQKSSAQRESDADESGGGDEASDGKSEDGRARRRREARERNRARRDARQKQQTQQTGDEQSEDSAGQGRSRRASRSAAQRLRDKMHSERPASQAPEADTKTDDDAPAEAKPARRRRSRASGKLKEKLTDVETQANEQESPAEVAEKVEFETPKRKRSSRAADRLKKKLVTEDEVSAEVEQPPVEDEAPVPKRSRRGSSAAARLKKKLGAAAEQSEGVSEETTEPEASANPAADSEKVEKPKRTRRRKTPTAASADASDEKPKPARRSRRKTAKADESKAAEETNSAAAVEPAAEPAAEPATDEKPKRRTRRKTTAKAQPKAAESTVEADTPSDSPSEASAEASATEASEEKPKRTRRRKPKAAAEPEASAATPEAEEAPKPKRTRRTRTKSAPAEAPAASDSVETEKPKRTRRTRKAAVSTAAAEPAVSESEASAEASATEAPPKKKRTTRRSASSAATPAAEPAAEEKPKRRTRKKKEPEPAAEPKPKRTRRTKKTEDQ